MSISGLHGSRKSIISQRHDDDQENTFLTRKLNLRYNGQIYFRNTALSRYHNLAALADSCRRISPEGLEHIKDLRLDQPGLLPQITAQPNVSDALGRISDNRRYKLHRKYLDSQSAADSVKSSDTIGSAGGRSHDSPRREADALKRTPDNFVAELQQYTQDTTQLQYIKRIGDEMQNEVPLPIMSILYKEVHPILNAIFQDYKKLFGQRSEHFMIQDVRNQAARVSAFNDALRPP